LISFLPLLRFLSLLSLPSPLSLLLFPSPHARSPLVRRTDC
jgi:hypothetical protein